MAEEERKDKKRRMPDWNRLLAPRIRRRHRRIIRDMHEEEKGQRFFGITIHSGNGKKRTGKEDMEGTEQNGDAGGAKLPEDSRENRRDEVYKEILDWVKHIVIAAAVGLLLVFFVVQRNEVIGSSMEPNLYENDQLLVEKISKLFKGGITYGDIITINAQGLDGHIGDKNIIKRVIGLPGDTIEIRDGKVWRNGVMLEEKYLTETDTSPRNELYSDLTLKDNEYYVLGDHRSVSLDSRTFGPVTKDRIIGEVLIRFYPFSEFGVP